MNSSNSSLNVQSFIDTPNTTSNFSMFKVPNHRSVKYKKLNSRILDEDTYIKDIGLIIERDFFPHLKKLKAQNEYLEALDQNDVTKIRQIYEKYSSGYPRTKRSVSPSTFDTPSRENLDQCHNEHTKFQKLVSDKKQKLVIKPGLDAYLSAYTSDDNASFEEMMIESENRRKLKYPWLYDVQPMKSLRTNSETEAGDKKYQSVCCIRSHKNTNSIMCVPDGVDLTPDEKVEIARKKQKVHHENTRLTVNPFDGQQNKDTVSESAVCQSKSSGKIGVDGKEVITNSTVMLNGYGFVTTPTPRPDEYDSPFMTWGQIEGTPFRLDGYDTPLTKMHVGPSFRMAEPPRREKIALQLAEKAGERHRDRKNKALEAARKSFTTPSPRSLPIMNRLATMSPAARRLATQKLKTTSSPASKNSSVSTFSINIKNKNCVSPNASVNPPCERLKKFSEVMLTDNLLNLPLRNRAADFFN